MGAARDQGSNRGLVHHLDPEASGPVLVGKTSKGYEHAKKQFAAGFLEDYVALVHGTFAMERGDCNASINVATQAQEGRVQIAMQKGKHATTGWESIAEYELPDS